MGRAASRRRPPARRTSGPEIASFVDAVEQSGVDGVWLSDVPSSSRLDPLLGLADHHDRVALGVGDAARGVVLEEVFGLVRRWWADEAVDHRSELWNYETVASAA